MRRPPSDAGAQIIVAHELTQCGNDQGQLVPLVEAIANNLGRKPEQASADLRLLQRSQSRSARSTTALTAMSRPTRQAPDSSERKSRRNLGPSGMRKKIDDGGFETP